MDFVTDFVVTCDDKSAYAADKCVRHSEQCATPITVTLEFYGRDVIASAFKIPKFRSR